MSAHALKPTFNDLDGYRSWIKTWRVLYKTLSKDIRKAKLALKDMQRNAPDAEETKKAQRNLRYQRVMASKAMTLRQDAKDRWKRIKEMEQSIAEQNASFPLDLGHCQTIDFHFNKGHLEFPTLPMWVIKTKGKSYYVNHVDSKIGWSTKERPDDKSTKGLIRFKHGHLFIDRDGVAHITAPQSLREAA